MATYPHPDSIAQVIGSEPVFDDGTRVDRATSGKPRLQSFYSREWAEFKIIHEVYQADLDTLLAFYAENKMLAFDFVWAGDLQTYTVRFAGSMQRIPIEGNLRTRVTVRLVGV